MKKKSKRESNITNVPPSFASKGVLDGYVWLDAKREDDNVEDGLWRIHNTLYDLTEFIDKHPGGQDWLKWTKGIDITEAVETHHVYPERLIVHLNKYRVRDTTKPRNSKLRFDENGFYVTLRKKVAEQLPKLKKSKLNLLSKFYIDGLFIVTLLSAILSLRYENYVFATLAGLFYTWTGIAGHNFFHLRDNYRMMYFNLLFMSYRDWRITHALSHHAYPNSLLDYEMVQYEPIFVWMPSISDKNWFQRYASWIYAPIIYVGVYHIEFVKKIIKAFIEKNTFHWDDSIPLIVPIVMYIFAGANTIFIVLKWYLIIVTISSFLFGFIGLNAGHHHPEALHDGDAVRKEYDWGIYQIDTIIDRKEIRGNTLFALTHFGDHVLHHLFPTVDHAYLPALYDILFETLNEFEAECRAYPWWQLVTGQFKQMARIQPMQESSHDKFKIKNK